MRDSELTREQIEERLANAKECLFDETSHLLRYEEGSSAWKEVSAVIGAIKLDIDCYNLALSALEGEEVWFIVNSATGVKERCSDENEARAIQKGWGSEWTVRRFRLVPVEG